MHGKEIIGWNWKRRKYSRWDRNTLWKNYWEGWHLKGQQMLLCHKNFYGTKSMNTFGKRFCVVIWISLFFKKWSDHFIIKTWSNHFLEKEVVHIYFNEMFFKALYDFKFDRPIPTLKNWLYQEYSWVQTTIKNIVYMDHFVCKNWSNDILYKIMIRALFA